MKLSISMQVPDPMQAVKFYPALFEQSPSIVRQDYVKWNVDDPAVNFVSDPKRTLRIGSTCSMRRRA